MVNEALTQVNFAVGLMDQWDPQSREITLQVHDQNRYTQQLVDPHIGFMTYGTEVSLW
jgi:hypothetical protein